MDVDRHNVSRRAVLGAGAAATVVAVTGTRAVAGEQAGSAAPDAPPSVAISSPAFDYLCRTCGGNSVTRDAWAEWDAEEQDWVLAAAFDYAYCHDCDQETHLVEVDLETCEPTEA